MRHWILMFRPETYEKVKEHGLIGVTGTHHRRIAEIAEGDRFVTYVSRKRVLDGHGVFTSTAFADVTPVFGVKEVYPYRARVRFEQTGAEKDAKELLWGLAEFATGEAKTTPSNMLFCRGGFMAITPPDYGWLRHVLDGSWVPPVPDDDPETTARDRMRVGQLLASFEELDAFEPLRVDPEGRVYRATVSSMSGETWQADYLVRSWGRVVPLGSANS